ncbi:cytochrome P450 [Phycicoccus avicenniae]|uniref:cytochrome P450 n=1 Tax=Phycicoccus avicenniae TaxID=2828860 RepID=UPI003D2E2A56
MPVPPVRPSTDVGILLLRHGYGFSSVLRGRSGIGSASAAPVLEIRLGGAPVVLLGGPEGVRAFTDTARFARGEATPAPLARVLLGRGAVHGLDDEEHRRRKELFVQALDTRAVDGLVADVSRRWLELVATLEEGSTLPVQRTSARLVGRAVLEWAGVLVPDHEADDIADRFATVVDGFGVVGPAFVRAATARRRSDRWAADVVHRARSGAPHPPAGSALEAVARWRGPDGDLLDAHTAGVELQNILRPTVAVSRLVAFAARTLVTEPRWRGVLRTEYAEGRSALSEGHRGVHATAFAREVRRLAPFVPLLAARSRTDQTVLGVHVPARRRVLLDVVGTLRDPDQWPDPLSFDPARFLGDRHVVADALVPQGGGSVANGHRCPGEDPALGILASSATALSLVAESPVGPVRPVRERRLPADPGRGVPVRVGMVPARVAARTPG